MSPKQIPVIARVPNQYNFKNLYSTSAISDTSHSTEPHPTFSRTAYKIKIKPHGANIVVHQTAPIEHHYSV